MGWIKGTLKIQINYKKERSFVILEILLFWNLNNNNSIQLGSKFDNIR